MRKTVVTHCAIPSHTSLETCIRHGCMCADRVALRHETYVRNKPFMRRQKLMAGGDIEVSAVGTMRRLQALAFMGWSSLVVAEMIGSNVSVMSRLVSGKQTSLRLSTARRVAALFDELVVADAPETHSAKCTRRKAALSGYVSWAAWDNIDDPNDTPKGVGVPRANGVDEELVERYWREGLSDREIGERMGCNYRSVFRVRKRMGWETKWAA